LVYATIVAWLLVGLIVKGWTLWLSPLEKVRVSGTLTLSSAQIVQMAGLRAGMRFGDIDAYWISKRLRQDSRVEAADARRVFPNTVWIDVRERVPDTKVKLGPGRLAVVDRYDVVIRVEGEQRDGLPVIRGVEADAVPGAVLAAPGLRRARIFLTLAKEAGISDFAHGALDVADPASIAVIRQDPSQRLTFPLPHAEAALMVYRRLVGPPSALPLPSMISRAREVDFRFAAAGEGGRVFVVP
jgi:hypothetical protein